MSIHNCRYWGAEKVYYFMLRESKVGLSFTVWCVFDQIVFLSCLYFMLPWMVTDIWIRYKHLCGNLVSFCNNVNYIVFMQDVWDVATSQYALTVREWVREYFPEIWIRRHHWHVRNPGLTQCGLFCGYWNENIDKRLRKYIVKCRSEMLGSNFSKYKGH